MKNLIFIFTAYLMFSLACKDKKSKIYEACCGAAPTVDSIQLPPHCFDSLSGVGRIYIPNIFIPDTTATGGQYDPENAFIIFGNQAAVEIVSVVLTDEQGEVLYTDQSFQPNEASRSWRGIRKDGSYFYGLFNYWVTIRFCDGQEKTYTGSACAFQCGDGGFPSENFPDCFFPSQNDGYAKPSKDIPAPEFCF